MQFSSHGRNIFCFCLWKFNFPFTDEKFSVLFLKNQCSSHGWNIFFFCLWKCIPSNALLTLNEKMQRTAHAEKIIRLKLNLIKSFAREMQPCLIAKGKNIHLWRKSNVKKDNRNSFPTEVQPKMACVLGLEPEYGIDGNKSSHWHLLSSSSLFVPNQMPHPSCQIQIFWQS